MLALLSILACHGPEKGIDRTELSGAVIIPPVRVSEDASNDDNNELDGPDLGIVTYRHMVATGTSSSFGVDDKGFPTGDGDGYLFTVADDGTSFDIMLEYAFDAGGDTKKGEPTVFEVDIYSADGSTFYSYTTTDGQQGLLVWPVALDAGSYVAIVYGLVSDGSDDSYTLTIGGLDPNTTTVMVGAYESGDIENLGAPVAGTTVAEFVLDEEDPDTWVGDFAMPPGLRTTTTCVVGTEGCADAKTTKDTGDTGDSGDSGDTGDSGDSGDTADTGGKDTGGGDTGGADTADTGVPPTHTTVVEGVDEVYVIAGTFSSLNSVAVGPGLFYSSDLQDLHTANETSHKDIVVALDTIVPKPIGWVVNEKEPNDAVAPDYSVVDLSLAQVLPPMKPGLANQVLGVSSFKSADPKYKSDVDVYRMDITKDSAVTWTMSWPDKDANLDMLLFAGDGTPVMAAYNKGAGDVNPEVMSTNDLGSLLKAGETWYLVVYAWTGPAGDHAYKIEIAAQ